jgi:hypothetical protein
MAISRRDTLLFSNPESLFRLSPPIELPIRFQEKHSEAFAKAVLFPATALEGEKRRDWVTADL